MGGDDKKRRFAHSGKKLTNQNTQKHLPTVLVNTLTIGCVKFTANEAAIPPSPIDCNKDAFSAMIALMTFALGNLYVGRERREREREREVWLCAKIRLL